MCYKEKQGTLHCSFLNITTEACILLIQPAKALLTYTLCNNIFSLRFLLSLHAPILGAFKGELSVADLVVCPLNFMVRQHVFCLQVTVVVSTEEQEVSISTGGNFCP